MVVEAGSVSTQVNSERIVRQKPVESENRQEEQRDVGQEGSYNDVANFSAQAIALARNVPPAQENNAQGQADQAGREQKAEENPTSRFLDIRV